MTTEQLIVAIATDGPQGIKAYASVKAVFDAMPKGAKVSDYAKALGVADGSALADVTKLVDLLMAQSKQ